MKTLSTAHNKHYSLAKLPCLDLGPGRSAAVSKHLLKGISCLADFPSKLILCKQKADNCSCLVKAPLLQLMLKKAHI